MNVSRKQGSPGAHYNITHDFLIQKERLRVFLKHTRCALFFKLGKHYLLLSFLGTFFCVKIIILFQSEKKRVSQKSTLGKIHDGLKILIVPVFCRMVKATSAYALFVFFFLDCKKQWIWINFHKLNLSYDFILIFFFPQISN